MSIQQRLDRAKELIAISGATTPEIEYISVHQSLRELMIRLTPLGLVKVFRRLNVPKQKVQQESGERYIEVSFSHRGAHWRASIKKESVGDFLASLNVDTTKLVAKHERRLSHEKSVRLLPLTPTSKDAP